jgi:hypothetical protein
MGTTAKETASEIEETRDDLARKVDELVGRAKVEAAEASKKLVIVVAALAGLFIIGTIAKRRVQN